VPGSFCSVGEGKRYQPEISGSDLEIACTAGSDGSVAVFLHEGLGCVAQWRNFPDHILATTGLPGVVYSRRGYGSSPSIELPRPFDYHTREALGDLKELLSHLGERRILLVGHSDGATIATCYAALSSDPRLCGLVLIAPHFIYETKALAGIARMRHRFVLGDLRAKLARYHGANVDCAFWGWCDRWLDPEFSSWQVKDLLAEVSVPTLYVQGDQDEFATLIHRDLLAAASKSMVETLIVKGAGHLPHLHPNAEKKIAQYLRTHS